MANGNQKDILQLLGGFLGNLREGQGTVLENLPKSKVARTITDPSFILQELLRLVGQGSKAVGVASTLKPGVAGEKKRVTQEIGAQLNPLQENVLKSVQKVHKDQVKEAMAQGASGEQILKDAGISVSPEQPTDEEGKPDKTSLALAGIQPPELAGQHQGDNIVDVLNSIISLGGFIQPSAQDQLARAQTQLIQQQIKGEKPLQVGEIQKIILQNTLDAEKAGTLTPQNLFTQFEKASQVFVATRDAHARVESAAQNPSPAGDLALIFNFMKVLDPGSVVRESEFANAQTAQRWVEAHGISWNKIGRVWRGERLSQIARSDFVDRSRRLFKAIQNQQNKTVREFQRLGRKSGIDPSVFIRDVGLVAGQLQTQPGPQEATGVTRSGNKFRRK